MNRRMPAGQYIKLTFRDNGSGIPSDRLARVFEPFYSSKGRERLGLGLSVAENTIRLHNGFLDLRSQENSGTTLIIYLPVGD